MLVSVNDNRVLLEMLHRRHTLSLKRLWSEAKQVWRYQNSNQSKFASWSPVYIIGDSGYYLSCDTVHILVIGLKHPKNKKFW